MCKLFFAAGGIIIDSSINRLVDRNRAERKILKERMPASFFQPFIMAVPYRVMVTIEAVSQ